MSATSAKPRPAVIKADMTMLFIRIKKINFAKTKIAKLKELSAKLRFLLLVMVKF